MNTRNVIREEYEQTAGHYDERWSYYIEATKKETLNRLRLPSSARVLDVGCGTGALLSKLNQVDRVEFLAGADLSAEMLRQASRKTASKIPLVTADAESLPFQSEYFDLIVSCNSFHFFLNPEQFLSEAKRVLRSGGQLVVTDWCDDFWACWLCDYYLRLTNDAHTTTYSSVEIRELFARSDFEIQTLDTYKIDSLWGLMTLRATLKN